jgi:hypothetical protein
VFGHGALFDSVSEMVDALLKIEAWCNDIKLRHKSILHAELTGPFKEGTKIA